MLLPEVSSRYRTIDNREVRISRRSSGGAELSRKSSRGPLQSRQSSKGAGINDSPYTNKFAKMKEISESYNLSNVKESI